MNALAAVNGGLNDEEAFNNAVAESLQEQSRPSRPIINSFTDHCRKVITLTDETEKKIAALRNLHFTTKLPADKPIPRLPKLKTQENEEILSSSQRLRRQQDAEYAEALRAAQAAEVHQPPATDEPDDYFDMISRRVSEIAPEPEEGLTIAIQLPNRERYSRKFAETTTGEDVYVWIAGNEVVKASGWRLFAFDLVGSDGKLEMEGTLSQQIVGHKTLLNFAPH